MRCCCPNVLLDHMSKPSQRVQDEVALCLCCQKGANGKCVSILSPSVSSCPQNAPTDQASACLPALPHPLAPVPAPAPLASFLSALQLLAHLRALAQAAPWPGKLLPQLFACLVPSGPIQHHPPWTRFVLVILHHVFRGTHCNLSFRTRLLKTSGV